MDVPVAARCEDFFGVVSGLVKVAAVLDQLGAEQSNRTILGRIVASRHDDRAVDSEPASRIRQRLTVIARRASEDSSVALGLGERAHEIDAPANLERSGRLMILVFEQDLAAQQLGKPRPIEKRGRSENAK